MYADVDGNKTYQGNTPAIKWSPRVGAVYRSTISRDPRWIWAVLGAVQLSAPSTAESNYGQVGLQPEHDSHQQPHQSDDARESVSNGVELPSGNTRGALTNLDSNISYVNQNRTAPRVHQFPVDLQRELPGNLGLTVSYMGARSDHIGLGGSNDIGVNINQLDPKYLAPGRPRWISSCPTRFLDNPNVPQSLSTPATLSRARLLRPFPQSGQSTPGRSPRASAAITPPSSSSPSACPTEWVAASATPTAGSKTTRWVKPTSTAPSARALR